MIYYPANVFTQADLCKPHIFEYHSPGTVTAFSEQAGFPASAAYNELTYERWKPLTLPATWQLSMPAAATINYCAIAAHTLSGKVVAIESSTDNITWTGRHTVSPVDNSPIVVMFANTSARYWRVRITAGSNSTIPVLGVIFFGTYLRMPWPLEVGFAPLSLSRKTTYSSNQSEGGNWLGRSVKRMGKSGTLSFKAMGRDWYRANVDPMILRARYKPFFYASNPFAAAWDVAYCWLTSDPKPTAQGSMLMDVSMEVEAHAHE